MALLPPPSGPTVSAIYAAYEAAADAGWREHLGASSIGTSCERALWYSFRWASRARHTGRLLRLFETGNLAEARFVANLRRIGVTVLDLDPDTGRQWNLRDAGGHFGGSMDAVAVGFPEAPKAWHVCEFKTHGHKSFAKLLAEGVERSKPLHWAQMQAYMHLAGIDRAFYLAVCKDTDELYQERIHHDAEAGLRILAKAQRIVTAARPPARISQDPAWWQCRLCDHHAVCHGDTAVDRHCRSCLHATPVDAGRWTCARHQVLLGRREQEAGCAAHLFIPDLVPGEQIDAGEDWVSYRLRDGDEWRDGPPPAQSQTIVSHGPCSRCHGTTYRVGPGVGPHRAQLICIDCGKGGRWLAADRATELGIPA